ncbi:FtsK/SpoIIIE domain-containing protein, partial [Kitasatospora sp. MBT63]|uniref:FtsK/SpoIIIE domain-containing protein n=1 Tax=Kitasatospora sp. MBT63 TaxID=1444768 RepID=UPI00053A553B
PRARVAGLARALVAQLATLHPPTGLNLVLAAADEEAAAEWTWAQWLPHLRPAHGQACRLLVGAGPEQTAARLAELAAVGSGPPATVVLVDGDPGTPAGREALAQLLHRGPADGVFTICLSEGAEQLPAGLGARALVTGEVGTLLTVERPAGGTREAATREAATREVVEEVALDAVPPAWAERLARVLAPLREAAPVARGPLPASLRLLDLLGLDSVTPAKVSARWSELPLSAGAAGALLGTARGGEPCTVDLADPELASVQQGGPHLLIGGGAGAGKTELLRTLIASLAVAERPERLRLTVIEGRAPSGTDEAGGLAGCTDLPHVTDHLNAAADPRQALLTAESLLDELTTRTELLGELGFTAWHAARRFARTPALVASGGTPAGSRSGDGPRIIEPRRAPGSPAADGPAPSRLIVVVDDYDALLAPTSAAGRPLARALAEVARRGGRLGVHLVAATGAPELTAGSEVDEAALLRIALRTDQPSESDLLIDLPDAAAVPEDTPGRGYLRRPDGGVTAFQAAKVSGRIPRTATLRPTVVAIDPSQLGAPPTRRPVRELGNGPTDLALLASALQRAAAG